jgi:hypothetical protein
MSGWVATGIAAAALVYTIVANWAERRQRRREFDLMRGQADLAVEDREEQRRAYVSVEAKGKEGGTDFDRHDFEVRNAGPALARHIALRIDRPGGDTVVEAVKVDPHLLRVGEVGQATLAVPRSERLADLEVVVEWVDPEQQARWQDRQLRKERVVESVEPVSRLP